MTVLGRLGVGFQWSLCEDGERVLVVHGTGGNLKYPPTDEPAYMGNAGTAARFITSLCCLLPNKCVSCLVAVCSMMCACVASWNVVHWLLFVPRHQYVVISGNDRMHARPIGDLVDCLRSQGAQITYLQREGCLPLRVYGGGLSGGEVTLQSSVSSQFASSVLMVAPFCTAPLRLMLSEDTPTSLPYIRMTVENMKQFGVTVHSPAPNVFHIPVQTYAPVDTGMISIAGCSAPAAVYSVEPDASSASYAAALAAITGTSVELIGVGSRSTQGENGAYSTVHASRGALEWALLCILQVMQVSLCCWAAWAALSHSQRATQSSLGHALQPHCWCVSLHVRVCTVGGDGLMQYFLCTISIDMTHFME